MVSNPNYLRHVRHKRQNSTSVKNRKSTKTHFLYRILDSKKTSRFQFSVPGLREIHRNLKQQKNFNSHDGFFRKSPFPSINPGFMQEKVQKGDFPKKPSRKLKFFFCFISNESLEGLEH